MGKFKIKIKPSSFSEDYIVLRYSTNGILWKSVEECQHDILDNWCYMVTKKSGIENAESLIEQFNTLEKIKQYETEQKDKVIKHNKEITEKNKKHKEYLNKIYNTYG